MTRLASLALGGALCIAAGCSLDVPDLNNPGLDTLENNPDAVSVGAACTGLLIGNRGNTAGEFGYVDEVGILGREAYNFDGADPRFVDELLAGQLSRGSPFGGNFWTGPYSNIRLGNVILHALDKVNPGELDDTQKSAIRGYIHTINAMDLLLVIVTHDTSGAVIDTDHELGEPLGAIVGKDAVYAEIARLLDDALPELDAGGKAFPFALPSGYNGFNTPPTFRKANRAIRARVAAYMKDYTMVLSALGMSFIDDSATGDLNLGPKYDYTTKTGDATNGLFNPNIFAHPSLQTDAQKKGTVVDARFTRKIATVEKPGGVEPLMSSLVFTGLYPSPSTPVPVIRNEELILLKAEALFFKTPSDPTGAYVALNLIRTRSGELDPKPMSIDPTTFTTDLLYERRYSLMFEWGHRWIDARRFNRMADLPIDDPAHMRNARFPIPLAECNARQGEPACLLSSL
jgi:hypothetical protein